MQRWAVFTAVFAVASILSRAIKQAAATNREFVSRWAMQPFESGMRCGIEVGRKERAVEEFAVPGGDSVDRHWSRCGCVSCRN